MGHRLLHQSHSSGRIGAFFARSKDTRGCREKVEMRGNLPLPGCPKSSDRFAILRDSARYPSGPRERSAKPPFVGSNPTRASKLLMSNVPAASLKLKHFFSFVPSWVSGPPQEPRTWT